LIRRLPQDSQLSHDTNGEMADWSRSDHLLAITVDLLGEIQWAYSSVHGEEKPTRPTRIPRPGISDSEVLVPAASNADIAGFLMS